MKKFIVAFYMIMIAAAIVAQSDYNQLTRDTGIYFANNTSNQAIELYRNDYRIPSVALHNGIYFNGGDLIRIGMPYPKEIKRINKNINKRNKEIRKWEKKYEKNWEKENKKAHKDIEKRNKEIRKQNEKNRERWEKEDKKAQKQRDKQYKKYKKQVKKIEKWY